MSGPDATPPAAVIFGCAGPALSAEERRFFDAVRPLGFILFGRNCETPDQIRHLTAALRDSVGRADAPVLIDQEGGRVARLRPPHWRDAPPAARFATLYAHDADAACEAAHLNARLMADELAALGIDVDCTPVLDLAIPGAHDIIGDRAYGAEPAQVAALGRAVCDGLLAGGVLPVIKHVPGHGRATADSHLSLPTVETPRGTLEATDFAPFRALNDMPLAMTAHVVYRAIDPAAPASVSPKVVSDVIRAHMGFDGLLMSDDLSMKALSGDMAARTRGVLEAGCDVALHCNGEMGEMKAAAEAAPPMSAAALARWRRARAMPARPGPVDARDGAARLDALLAKAVA